MRPAMLSPATGLPSQQHLAAHDRHPPGDRFQQLGAPGAHQAVDADDLARAHVK